MFWLIVDWSLGEGQGLSEARRTSQLTGPRSAAFGETFPQGIGHSPLDAAHCLPCLFDLLIAKPLTYSASLVSSEVVALMAPARVTKNEAAEEASVIRGHPHLLCGSG